MDEIQIGSSDLRVPRVGIGAMPWSDSRGFGYGSRLGLGEARKAFEACIAAGIRLFDTAEIYGFGKSERILGELVRESVLDHPGAELTIYAVEGPADTPLLRRVPIHLR